LGNSRIGFELERIHLKSLIEPCKFISSGTIQAFVDCGMVSLDLCICVFSLVFYKKYNTVF